MKKMIFTVLAMLVLTACIPMPQLDKYSYTFNPETATETMPFCKVTLEPNAYNKQLHGFILSIENTSTEPIEVDWNKSLFIQNGQTNGGFMFEGIIIADRNNPRMPDIVLPGLGFKKMITPNVSAHYDPPNQYSRGGWVNYPLTGGNQGAYITMKHNGKETGVKLAIDVAAIKLDAFGQLPK